MESLSPELSALFSVLWMRSVESCVWARVAFVLGCVLQMGHQTSSCAHSGWVAVTGLLWPWVQGSGGHMCSALLASAGAGWRGQGTCLFTRNCRMALTGGPMVHPTGGTGAPRNPCNPAEHAAVGLLSLSDALGLSVS